MRETINITRGTDVVLNDRLIYQGATFDPSLAVNLEAHLVSRAGVRTPLGVQIIDDYLVITIPWVTGRVAGLYGLEVRGVTNGLRWATYADSLIRYTTATVEGDDPGSVLVEADAYDITQQVSYRYGESPIAEVKAQYRDTVGPPAVSVSYISRVLSLVFEGLRGNGITSLQQTTVADTDGGTNVWTATLDNGAVATISVRNGSRGNGIASVEKIAESFADGGMNTWRVTESDGRVTDISVRNGSTGPQGATSVYDQTTQNFLTTLETTTGDSQTKTMTQKAITDEFTKDRINSLKQINIGDYLVSRWIINSSGVWSQASKATTGSSYIFRINPGETFKVNYNLPDDKLGNVEFLKAAPVYSSGGDPGFAGSGRIGWLEDHLDTYYFTAPDDAHYMYIRGLAGAGDDRTPTYVGKVTKTKDLVDEIPSLLSTKTQYFSESQRAQVRENFGISEAVNGDKANYLPGLVYAASSTTSYVLANAAGCNVLTEFIPVGAGTKAMWYFGQQVNDTVAQAIIYDSNKQPVNYWNMGVDNVAKGYRDISHDYNAGYIRFSFFDNDINGNPLELVAEVNGVKYYKHGVIQSVVEEKDAHWKPLILGELIPYYINASGDIGIQSDARAATHDMIVFPKTNCRLRFKAPSEDFFIKVWEYNSKGGAPWEARNARTQGKWFFDGDTYTVPSDKSCYRILFTLRDAEMTEGYIQSLIDNGQIAIEYYDEDESNLFDRNSHMENFARNAMRRLMNPTTPAGIKASNPNNIPTFAHTSDVHGDAARLKNFIEYSKFLGVDAIVNTGDTCNYIHAHGATFQNALSAGCGNYLFAVGNHDAKSVAEGEDVFTDIMEPLVEDNGYLEASGTPTTHTYWYRDFYEKKIRVIAIDYYATGYPGLGQAQLSWFVDTLAATPTGYGVIILMHSPEDAVVALEGYEKFMQPSPKYGDIFEPNGTYVGSHPIRAIIDAFIARDAVSISYTDNNETVSVSADFTSLDASTEFIAYMVGHRHEDNVGYYGNSVITQLCLGVVCGTGMYGDADHAAWTNQSDLVRADKGVTQDAFNIYGIDRENGEIRIARIGATVTERMEVRDYMIIPYK